MIKYKKIKRKIKNNNMKILIIGTVATGKTTLARKLSKKYKIKYYEIDSIVHDDESNGRKRTKEEQNEIINKINKNKDWIIEGVLRKNLEYLLELADEIIYLDIPKYKRNIRILIRFVKQKLKIEKVNYKPNFEMLKNMYKWSNEDEKRKNEIQQKLNKHKNKLKILKK